MTHQVVGPDRVVTEVWDENGATLFEVTAWVGDGFVVIRTQSGGELCINSEEIGAVIAAIQRAEKDLDRGLDEIVDV